ncbi:uncharacterized protein BDV17DRAFT_49955 [Aspergillus undulatus]|uniref:uncharacterized protein n=1 Tax=Aspergillus undulatus TaxID=1810928 RepID=UPI003CCCBC51
MLVPKPPAKLEGHCSVIHNNTLYTLSENGFAFIPLELDAKWQELPTDGAELVSDAACVTGDIDGNEQQQALYVIGGTSGNSDAPGWQRYSFADKKWKTMPAQADLANRTGHAAVYLKAISTLLIYGGTRDGKNSDGSADTFKLSTKPDYIFEADSTAPASSNNPNLLTWSDEQAVLFGGNEDPTAVNFWNSKTKWHSDGYSDSDYSYPNGVKTALFSQPDGNYRLRTFNSNASPVTVGDYELKPDPADPAQSKKRKREDDDSLAPTSIEKGFSFAQSNSGDQLVVLSGGSGTDTLSIFNQSAPEGGSWVNSTKLFYGDKSEEDILGLTPTASSTPTATPSESSSVLPTVGDGTDDDNIGVILGAVLGSLAGVAIILVLILFYIKRKKEKMRQAAGADKDRLSFQDQGVEPLTRSAYPMAQSPAPKAASSVDSLAIFSGNMGDEKSPKTAGSLPQYMQKNQPARPSPLNNIQSRDSADWDDKVIEAGESPVRPGDRTTDEGWGKYFQDNHTTPTLVGIQSPFDSTRGSKATIWPGENNTNSLPPLQTSFLAEPTPLGRVNSGSPTTEFATSVRDGRQIAIPQSQSARISSASAETASINSDDDDRYHDARERSWLGRPPSSNYSRSFYNPGSTRDVTSTAAPSTVDWRKHDSARTNTRGSSIIIPEGQPLPRNNVNSDMSWLNLNADR